MKAHKSSRVLKEAQETRESLKEYKDNLGLSRYSLSPSQKTMQNILRENTLSFVEGPAGTGKTLGILHYFCQEYLRDKSKSIVVVRTPAESAGKDKIGYLPSDLKAKIEPHFASTKKILSDLLSPGKVESDLEKRLHFMSPNFMLGCTLDNSLILIDEGQMLEPLVLKLCLERIGQNSLCVVSGDPTQVYSHDKGRNAMSDAISRFFTDSIENPVYNPKVARYPEVGYFKFHVADCMRSDIVKTVIHAYSV